MKNIQELVNEGVAAAKEAEKKFREQHGEPFYCGFAWVEVTVDRTNSKVAKELIAAGFKTSYKPRVLTMWNPGGSCTQSMDIKEAGAHAMASVLTDAGLSAYACSRAD